MYPNNPSHKSIHAKGTEMIPITNALVRIPHLLKTGLAATALLAVTQQAYAENNWPDDFLAEYPQAGPTLTAAAEDCSLCHTQVPQRNAYGLSIQPANDGNIRDRLVAVESVNSDGDTDGANNACDNITEINADTLPGDAARHRQSAARSILRRSSMRSRTSLTTRTSLSACRSTPVTRTTIR